MIILIKLKKNILLFIVGGLGYGSLEILCRGYTHWSMVMAGGICFILFSVIAEKFRSRNIFFKAVLCALSVTFVELVFGIVFNILLKQNVWDYSNFPLNFMGQICPRFTLLWGVLAVAVIPLADAFNKRFSR